MGKRVTIYDVAKKLNVSTATVNRALNGKPKVGEKTRRLVIDTAKEMGYRPNIAAKSLSRKAIRIGVIVNNISLDFNEKVLQGAQNACSELVDFNVSGEFFSEIQRVPKEKIFERIRDMAQSGCDGVIIAPSGDIGGYDKEIEFLLQQSIPVVTVISDVPESGRLFSVRTNARFSGKMAEEILWATVEAKQVAIFTGNKDIGVHRQNIEGFREQMKSNPLELAAVYENYDSPDIAWYTAEKMLDDYPNIGGIYIATSNSISICQKIIEKGLAGKVKIVASDVFPKMIKYIREGVVQATIFQEPFNIGRLAFQYLYEHIANHKEYQREILLRPQIVLSSNLDLYIEK